MIELKEFNISDFLTDDDIRNEYLNQVVADGDIEEIKEALFIIAKSKDIEKVAKRLI